LLIALLIFPLALRDGRSVHKGLYRRGDIGSSAENRQDKTKAPTKRGKAVMKFKKNPNLGILANLIVPNLAKLAILIVDSP
jgi:hypothetical protein